MYEPSVILERSKPVNKHSKLTVCSVMCHFSSVIYKYTVYMSVSISAIDFSI